MTTVLRPLDDHVLVVTAEGKASIECPHVGDPEKRRGKCGMFEACACDQAYRLTRDKLWRYFLVEIDTSDWIQGYDDTNAGRPIPGPAIGDAHEDCPHHDVVHQAFDGEIVVPGTTCSYVEELSAYGADLYGDFVEFTGPGRYIIKIAWNYDESEVELLERLD